MFRIFITNLEKYNEGELIGKWLDLPCNNIDKELSASFPPILKLFSDGPSA